MRGIRFLLAGIAFVGFMATPALADNDVGCGLGTQLMEGQEGLIPHVLASCTNAYTLQSISLTFNMFGCDSTSTVTADANLRKFVGENIDALARDIAQGDGEALAAFAHLLEVPDAQHAQFAAFAQSRFGVLFPHAGVDSNEVVDAFYGLIGVTPAQG